jgi:hypothetical protein
MPQQPPDDDAAARTIGELLDIIDKLAQSLVELGTRSGLRFEAETLIMEALRLDEEEQPKIGPPKTKKDNGS